MFFVWVGFSSYGAFLNSKKSFLYFFELVTLSYLVAAVIVKIIHKTLKNKFSFENIFFDSSWVLILSLGSLFFAYYFFYTMNPQDFEIYLGVFLLSAVPAGLFRLLINFIKSFPPDSKDSELSIING